MRGWTGAGFDKRAGFRGTVHVSLVIGAVDILAVPASGSWSVK